MWGSVAAWIVLLPACDGGTSLRESRLGMRDVSGGYSAL